MTVDELITKLLQINPKATVAVEMDDSEEACKATTISLVMNFDGSACVTIYGGMDAEQVTECHPEEIIL